MNALMKLQGAVAKAVVKCDKLDTQRILDEGFEDFSNAMLALCDVPKDLMEQAKLGDNIYSQPLALYSKIQHLASEMVKVKELKAGDFIRYAKLTGHSLQSVIDHKADSSRRVSKAIINGEYISTPLIKQARDARECAIIARDTYEMQLNQAIHQISLLPVNEQKKHNTTISDALLELDNLKIEAFNCEDDLLDLVSEAKEIEKEYSYSFDANGKKVFTKDSEFNKLYSSIIKEGRTSLTEFARFRKLGGIEQVIPLYEVDKACKTFGVGK